MGMMSTRATIHFYDLGEKKPESIIYRHTDGYPKETGVDLYKFFQRLSKLNDPRFHDASMLAARYVVYLAEQFATDFKKKKGKWILVPKKEKLDFLSVRVLPMDTSDTAFRYVVRCGGGGFPTVKCFNTTDGKQVPIPLPKRITKNPRYRASDNTSIGVETESRKQPKVIHDVLL
jgi:hypothetical protein